MEEPTGTATDDMLSRRAVLAGMGAFTLLSRRIGMRAAEELITSGRVMPAAKLHEMGVVDILVKKGEGEAATRNWIAKNHKRRNALQAIYAARQHVHLHAAAARLGDQAVALAVARARVDEEEARHCQELRRLSSPGSRRWAERLMHFARSPSIMAAWTNAASSI